MARGDWQPGQYERFQAQRAQPFWDLAGMLDTSRPIGSAVDLGCGTGVLTAELAARSGVREMLGVDNSPNMLSAAEEFASDRVSFMSGDIATWTGNDVVDPDVDLVFSNAALHWVRDHGAVLSRWVGALRHGGQIAVQVPANDDHASHLASVAVAHAEPFVSAMGGAPPPDPVTANVLRPEEYSTLLHELGVSEPRVELRVYPHVFPTSGHVVEWTKGSSLTRFFKVLPDELHDPFVDAYRDELLARIGRHEPYLYTFKRILIWGQV